MASLHRDIVCGLAREPGPVARGIGFEDQLDLIPNVAKAVHNLFVGADRLGGIEESPVVSFHLAGIGGTRLIGIAAYGDDSVDVAIEKGIHMLGFVLRDIDADFVERLNRLGVHVASRMGASGVNIK